AEPQSALTDVLLFNVPVPTPLFTLSLHDALPICVLTDDPEHPQRVALEAAGVEVRTFEEDILDVEQPTRAERIARSLVDEAATGDRKSTRLNSSHVKISYAVFCLKKKKDDDSDGV